MKQATYWYAQLYDGTKMSGGRSHRYETDLNINAVPVEQLKVLSMVHNTYTDTYYAPWDTWYHDGKPFEFLYPSQYQMQDGSVVTIDFDDETGYLVLTQTYGG
jgi:inorganic pyrophosphatase